MIEELPGPLILFAVRVVNNILGLFEVLRSGSRTLMENFRVGESPMEAESRRWWDRLDDRWFWLSLLLVGIAAALGVSGEWW